MSISAKNVSFADPTPIFPDFRFCRFLNFPITLFFRMPDFAKSPICRILDYADSPIFRKNLTARPTEFRPIGKFAEADPKMPIFPTQNRHPVSSFNRFWIVFNDLPVLLVPGSRKARRVHFLASVFQFFDFSRTTSTLFLHFHRHFVFSCSNSTFRYFKNQLSFIFRHTFRFIGILI